MRRFVILMALATAVRLAGCFGHGSGDPGAYMEAGAAFLDHGTRSYFHSALPYPPLSHASFGAAEWLARHALPFLPRRFSYNLLIQAVSAMALWALYRFLARLRGSSAARMAVLLIWLNPAAILNSPLLGYMDPLLAFWMLLTLIATLSNCFGIAGICYGLAILTKQTALVLAPVLATVAASQGRARPVTRSVLTALEVVLAGFVPYALAGSVVLGQTLLLNTYLLRVDMMSGHAMNLWWVLQWIVEVIRAAPADGLGAAIWNVRTTWLPMSAFDGTFGFPGTLLSLALIAPLTIGIALGLLRRLREGASCPALLVFEAAALQTLAYFVFSHRVHENHLALFFFFWPVVFALEEDPARARRALVGGGILAALTCANLAGFYGVGLGEPWTSRTLALLRPPGLPDLSVVYSLAFLGVTVWLLWERLARRER